METAPPGMRSPLIPANICRRRESCVTVMCWLAYLGVILQVGGFRPHHDGDNTSPGRLGPLDVACGNVGGEVVTLRQHLVQAGGQTLGQDTYTRQITI